MALNFKEALQNRRTYYTISNKSLISDKEIEDIVKFAVTHALLIVSCIALCFYNLYAPSA